MQSIVLGTAQWGLDYGVTNVGGRLSDHSLLDLLNVARVSGIDSLDTAEAYGDAEERIGQVAHGFRVVTKVNCAGLGAQEVLEDVRGSLRRLGRDSLDGCLVHDWPSLGPAERREAAIGLRLAQEDGLATQIGVSGYEVDDFKTALATFPSMSLAQGPLNALDQRLSRSGVLEELAEAGVAFEARSAFLQGLLLSGEGSVLGGVVGLVEHPDVVRFRSAAAQLGMSGLDLALGYVRSVDSVDHLVLGVTSGAELAEILMAWDAPVPEVDWQRLESADLNLLDPRRWTQENG
jgi:aryl-alcohol dehydrogenase-like predicted oxidoreductase